MDGIGLDMFAKTGTTDNAYDLTFMGGTNFCVAGIWNGYEYSAELYDSNTCKVTWRAVSSTLPTTTIGPARSGSSATT